MLYPPLVAEFPPVWVLSRGSSVLAGLDRRPPVIVVSRYGRICRRLGWSGLRLAASGLVLYAKTARGIWRGALLPVSAGANYALKRAAVDAAYDRLRYLTDRGKPMIFRLTGPVQAIYAKPWSSQNGERSGTIPTARIALSDFTFTEVTLSDPLVGRVHEGQLVDLMCDVESVGRYLRATALDFWPDARRPVVADSAVKPELVGVAKH